MQDYDFWRRYPPEGTPRVVGHVPFALNQAPLTWEEAGLDPGDPFLVDKWEKAIHKRFQGFDPDGALIEEAKRKGINFKSVR